MNQFFAIRPGRQGDHAFVHETWQYNHSLTEIGREMGPRYISEMKTCIRRILSWPETMLRVAVDPDDDDAIHGYSVTGYENDLIPTVYFVYVKTDSRRLGVATALLGNLPDRQCIYTHKPIRSMAGMPRPKHWMFSYFHNFYNPNHP